MFKIFKGKQLRYRMTRSQHSDLLKLYIRNHDTSLWVYLIVFLCFIGAKNHLYGVSPYTDENMLMGVFLGVSMSALYCLKKLYSKWQNTPQMIQNNIRKILVQISILKVFLIYPWLLLLFWPLEVTSIYQHLLGYFFVFCIISVYTTASSPYYLLLVVDILMVAGFSLLMAVMNSSLDEILYIQVPLIVFALYNLSVSLKNYRSAKTLIQKEVALKKALKKAEQSHQAKSDFLAMMSHEIRTPMVGITGMIDFLKETRLSSDQKECLDTIASCSKTLLNTLNDVLDISKMQAGQLLISKTRCNLYKLVRGVQQSFKELARQKNIDFIVSIHSSVPEYIQADPNRIQQIIFNLLNNAFKFTHTGHIHVSVSFDKMIRFEIEDTGIGISQKEQKKLFQKFSQVDGSITREYGGSGLGLFIVRNLLKSMKGDIGVNSKKGEGSRFWFEIPYELPQKESVAIAGGGLILKRSLRILLVDDNELNRKIISKYLISEGHKVAKSFNGRDAIIQIQQQPFDVVLMDMQMPGIDGIETTVKIRELGEAFCQIPIIALSANVLKKDVDRCKEAGMVDHIAKPINRDQMFEIIYRHAVERPVLKDEVEPRVVKSENKVIETLIEEFGVEYAESFVNGSIDEIKSKIQTLNIGLMTKSYKKAAAAAHDLVSLTGNIGLTEISEVARKSEKEIEDKKQKKALETFSKFKKMLEPKLEEAKSMLEMY